MALPIDLVVFDLDGTLVDSLPDIAAAANHALGRLGLPERPLEVHRRLIGQGEKKFIRRLLGEEHQHLFDQALKYYLEYYLGHAGSRATVYPGVKETLPRLRSLPLAVLSNKRTDLCVEVLKAMGLAEFFRAIRGGDSYGALKPSGDGLLALIRELGGEPAKTLMVGDKPEDVLTGREAGARTAALTYGYSDPETLKAAGPDYLLDSFPQVAELLGR